MGVVSGLYMYDVVVKRSRSLSYLLMSSCAIYIASQAHLIQGTGIDLKLGVQIQAQSAGKFVNVPLLFSSTPPPVV